MADLNFPSMFDTRYAIDRQMQEDAMLAGQTLSDPLGAGMMYASHLSGDMYGQGLMGIAGMFGGGDPRIQQQQALDEIMAKFPNPQTSEDFIEIANALGGVGLHSYAEAAMDMANDIRSSQPAKSNAWKEYTEMTSNPTPQGFQEWYNKYKVTTGKGGYKEVKTEDPTTGVDIIETYQIGADGLIVPNSTPVFTRTVDKASSTITDPTKIAQTNILNKYINEASASLRLLPEWSNATEEQIMGEARVIGSEKFLEEAPVAGDTSTNVDDFNFWKNRYPTWTDDEVLNHIASMKPTSPQNVIKTELFKTNLGNINELQKEMNLKVDQAYRDQTVHEAMLEAFDIGAKTGFGEDFKLAVNQFGVNFLGLDPSKGMVATEILQSQMKQMTLDRMEKLKGTPSDKDLDLVYAAGATMDKSPEANMIIIAFELFLEQELINRQKFMLNWVDKYTKDHPNEYPSAAQYMTVEDAFRNRNDESRWSPLAGTEADRQLAISIWGTNEFTKGRELLANLDVGSDVIQTEISESKILSNRVEAANEVMKQLGY